MVSTGYIERPRGRVAPGGRPESYPPICLDDESFLISRADFEALPDYTGSKPTGVYDGQCWKMCVSGEWWIACFLEESPPHLDGMLTPYRRALVVDCA